METTPAGGSGTASIGRCWRVQSNETKHRVMHRVMHIHSVCDILYKRLRTERNCHKNVPKSAGFRRMDETSEAVDSLR